MIKSIDLRTEPIFTLILKMSWPSIIAMTAMSVYNFIDTFWLARLSSQALAALTICFPIQMIFAAIGVGTGIGAGSFSAAGGRAPTGCPGLSGNSLNRYLPGFLRQELRFNSYPGGCACLFRENQRFRADKIELN